MNIYDFDDTIYSGDSTLDFYWYCLKNYPRTFLAVPIAFFGFALFKLSIISKTLFKQRFFSFLRYVPEIDSVVLAFWDNNESKIQKWYLKQKRVDDIIISASPEFLLMPICNKLGVKLIASQVNKHTGVFTGENCYGEEKIKRLVSEYKKVIIEKFYSDSLSDYPLAKLAKNAYLVKGTVITDWEVS